MMKFLKRLRQFWASISGRANLTPAAVGPTESVIRYLRDEDQFNFKKGTVSQAAFKPSKRTKNLSVYRADELTIKEIFAIGREFVEVPLSFSPDHKPILAGARLIAETFYSQQLAFDPDGIPHPRHANVIGWPWEADVQRDVRVYLASKAELIPRQD